MHTNKHPELLINNIVLILEADRYHHLIVDNADTLLLI